jgi:hypothetical protein
MKQQVALVLAAAASSFVLICVGAIASVSIRPTDMSPPVETLPPIPSAHTDALSELAHILPTVSIIHSSVRVCR